MRCNSRPSAVEANEGVFLEGCDPHGAFAIEADAIGRLHASEAATKLQAAVGLDVVIGEAGAIHFGDDEPAVIGRDRDAVGKPQSFGDHARRAVGHHQNDAAGRAAIGRRRHIEAEIADIGAAKPVDDHVVDRAGRDL